ncbi:MAG: hypothetical protein S4CHLAM2_15440 [Chlamydiales bacterium]|nr:hypothetical protein [Chlamydiales bacterium]
MNALIQRGRSKEVLNNRLDLLIQELATVPSDQGDSPALQKISAALARKEKFGEARQIAALIADDTEKLSASRKVERLQRKREEKSS